MNLTSTKKTIIGTILTASIAVGGVTMDNMTVTDAEVKASINEAVKTGKIPAIDLEKVSFDRLSKAYLEVALDYNIDLTSPQRDENVYELIRDKKADNGEKLSPQTEELLLVK